jgi:hypothetical protein
LVGLPVGPAPAQTGSAPSIALIAAGHAESESCRSFGLRRDEDWAYAVALEIRDRLRDILHRHKELAAAWEAQPPAIEDRWKALAAAFVRHEFGEADLPAPTWTLGERLSSEWVLDTSRADRGRDQAADAGVAR